MSSAPFLGEICIFPFNFAPRGWAVCDGQLLAISSNTAVFSLLGTFYGAEAPGAAPFVLQSEIPQHTHMVTADGNHFHDTLTSPSAGYLVNASPNLTFSSGQASPTIVGMSPAMIGVAGSSAPHNNLMPYLTLNFCIALQGVFPARS